MDILVTVNEGRIEVVHSRGERPAAFRAEPDAARFIAERVAATDAPVNFHHSCLYPEGHGRPDFRKPAFVEDIQDQLYAIRHADRPRAM